MLKINRKGLNRVINRTGQHEVILDWRESNLINMSGYFKEGSIQDVIENIGCNKNKELVISSACSRYRGIRTIERKVVTIKDLKLLDDILQNYPEYELVVFEETIDEKKLYQYLVNLAKKYENVLFVWTTNLKRRA